MKKLGKIKLNEFSKAELDQRKLNALKGGCSCGSICSCVCGGGIGLAIEDGSYNLQDPDTYSY